MYSRAAWPSEFFFFGLRCFFKKIITRSIFLLYNKAWQNTIVPIINNSGSILKEEPRFHSYLVNLNAGIVFPNFRVYFNRKYENDALIIGSYLEDVLLHENNRNALVFLYCSEEE